MKNILRWCLMKENKYQVRKVGWKFSYKTQVRKQINIDGHQKENLRVEGSNMALPKGGFSWCLLLSKAERHLKSQKIVNSLETTFFQTHTNHCYSGRN